MEIVDSVLGQKRYGGIVVRGSGGAKMISTPVSEQHELAEIIRSISSASTGKTDNSPAVSVQQSSDLYSQIKGLEELRSSGILTEQEFNSAKSKLLGN